MSILFILYFIYFICILFISALVFILYNLQVENYIILFVIFFIAINFIFKYKYGSTDLILQLNYRSSNF